MFTGCGTALITPFRPDQSLDQPALRRLLRRQIDAGIDFLVPCGTTGESPTLEHAEHLRVVEITLEEAKPRSIRVCVLLEKKIERAAPVDADYVGFQIGNEFVVGYGLDYMERYRNLPCIGVLRKNLVAP